MPPNNEKQEPMLVANLTDEQEQFLQGNSSRIGENYFIPYWFRRIDVGKYEMLPLGNLPESMSREIEEMREQVERKSAYAIFDDSAYFKKEDVLKPLTTDAEFDDAVKRYLDHPKDETDKERADRINRFRCGY